MRVRVLSMAALALLLLFATDAPSHPADDGCEYHSLPELCTHAACSKGSIAQGGGTDFLPILSDPVSDPVEGTPARTLELPGLRDQALVLQLGGNGTNPRIDVQGDATFEADGVGVFRICC